MLATDAASRKLVLLGGHRASNASPYSSGSDVWLFDGADWSQASPSVDLSAGFLVSTPGGLFGFLNDLSRGYRWTGSQWAVFTTANHLPESPFTTIAYDAVSGKIIVTLVPAGPDCGMTDPPQPCPSVSESQTWGLDPKSLMWSKLATGGIGDGGSASPVTTVSHPGGVMVLISNGESWNWDGRMWSAVPSTQQHPLQVHADLVDSAPEGVAATYDPSNGRVMAFGGSILTDDFDDTWGFTVSTGWTLLGGTPVPTGNFPTCRTGQIGSSFGTSGDGTTDSLVLTAQTPCHLAGDLSISLRDSSGTLEAVKGNPLVTHLDVELSPQGNQERITFSVGSACVPFDGVFQLRIPVALSQDVQTLSGTTACDGQPPGASMSLVSIVTLH